MATSALLDGAITAGNSARGNLGLLLYELHKDRPHTDLTMGVYSRTDGPHEDEDLIQGMVNFTGTWVTEALNQKMIVQAEADQFKTLKGG